MSIDVIVSYRYVICIGSIMSDCTLIVQFYQVCMQCSRMILSFLCVKNDYAID